MRPWEARLRKESMSTGLIGRDYKDGEVIVRQGEAGTCMYMIVSGKAEVLDQEGGKEVRLAVLGPRDSFGELAIFDRETRSATVRAMGQVRTIVIDKKSFERSVVESPWLAFRVLEKMSRRIRELDRELVELKRVAKRPTRARKAKP
jgi:CRP/FNR family cyclic AMP-dependent transcriptional regulator